MVSFHHARLVLLAASTLSAAPEDEVVVAAMRLAEEPGYSWSTTVIDNARSYTIEGRTLAGGYTWVRLPLVESVALRLPWTPDEYIEAVFKDPDRYVLLTPTGWKTPSELPRRHEDWADDDDRPRIQMRNVGNLLTREGQRPYSNAQFALDRPQDQLAIVVSSIHDLEVGSDKATGTLSNLGAQLLLVADNQEGLKPVIAAGRFTLWIEDGHVTRYLIELEGVVLVRGQPCIVNQTASTVLAKVGTTTVDVPAVVQAKLGP